jgi:hypothetical protein
MSALDALWYKIGRSKGLLENWQNVINLYTTFKGSDISGSVELNLPNVVTVYEAFMNCTGLISAKLFVGTGDLATAQSLFDGCTSLTDVEITGTLESVTTMTYAFYDCVDLVEITGTPLDLTACEAADSWLNNCGELTTISFAPNTIKIDIGFAPCSKLSSASLLSIANGLDGNAESKTLTMHATSKTAMTALMVNNVDGVAVVATDPDTDMTLTAFIGDVKGWTIA